MKYIIAGCIGQKGADGNLPNGLECRRAVYFSRYDEKLEYDVPTGLPIMFLRDEGMEESANLLIEYANKYHLQFT